MAAMLDIPDQFEDSGPIRNKTVYNSRMKPEPEVELEALEDSRHSHVVFQAGQDRDGASRSVFASAQIMDLTEPDVLQSHGAY